MRVVELENGNVYSEFDINLMDIEEIKKVVLEIQSEIFKLGKEKIKLATLPRCAKDGKTFKRINRISDRLTDLSESLSWIGSIKKSKRDSMAREKAWFKEFYLLSKDSIRKGAFNKLVEKTNEKIGYSCSI